MKEEVNSMKLSIYFVTALAASAVCSFAQTEPATGNYQPPPGYKLVPIDQAPGQAAPAQPPVYQPNVPVNQAPAQQYGQSYQAPAYQPAPTYQPAPPVAVPVVINRMSDAEVDNLTGQIALYPDPLVAIILPAATFPLEVGAAAQFARMNPDAPEYAIQSQPWQPSVKALVHYPTVLEMMAERPDWTQRLGAAFLNQPGDVTNSIQRLRYQAQAAGSLYSTPQQQVVNDNGTIRIIPADPRVVYVPTYDPAIVYVRHEHPIGGAIVFGRGFYIGTWLNFDVDWRSHWVVVGPRWDHHDVDLVREPWRREVILHDDHRFDRHDDHRDDRRDWRH
jgi:hypothetical protein